MEDRFVAMEGFLDKFRKSKLYITDSQWKAKLPAYATAEEFVKSLSGSTSEDDKTKAKVGKVPVVIRGKYTEKDEGTLVKIIKNAIHNAPTLHKSICMNEITEYNNGEGKEGPWLWVNEGAPFKKKGLSDIEHEIQLDLIDINFVTDGSFYIDYWFNDGPNQIYGGHSLVTKGGSPNAKWSIDFKLTEDGKYAGTPGKYVSYSLEG